MMERNFEFCPNFEQPITLSLEIASTKIVGTTCILGYGVGKSLKQWPFKALGVHELYQVNMYSFCKDFPQYSLMEYGKRPLFCRRELHTIWQQRFENGS